MASSEGTNTTESTGASAEVQPQPPASTRCSCNCIKKLVALVASLGATAGVGVGIERIILYAKMERQILDTMTTRAPVYTHPSPPKDPRLPPGCYNMLGLPRYDCTGRIVEVPECCPGPVLHYPGRDGPDTTTLFQLGRQGFPTQRRPGCASLGGEPLDDPMYCTLGSLDYDPTCCSAPQISKVARTNRACLAITALALVAPSILRAAEAPRLQRPPQVMLGGALMSITFPRCPRRRPQARYDA